jgi:lipoprotein-anchoring transpeptidase ErfK/SrfK
LNAVFRGRRPTGEIYSAELARAQPDRDWILTRILWLSGTEIGRNRLGSVDTMRRYIYIHGAPDSEPLGSPSSIGCVRMASADVAELFELVPVGTVVDIA